jgi:hypothetical protein
MVSLSGGASASSPTDPRCRQERDEAGNIIALTQPIAWRQPPHQLNDDRTSTSAPRAHRLPYRGLPTLTPTRSAACRSTAPTPWLAGSPTLGQRARRHRVRQ